MPGHQAEKTTRKLHIRGVREADFKIQHGPAKASHQDRAVAEGLKKCKEKISRYFEKEKEGTYVT